MDPAAILNAANVLSLPTLLVIVAGGVVYGGVKVVGWASEVTKLLGNHLRHDLAAQTEALARIESSMTEQTLVLRAVGRMLMEHSTGHKDF